MATPTHHTLSACDPPEAESVWLDRERIAEHLTNTLVREISRTSLDLHSALSRVHNDHAAQKIRDAIARLDRAIHHIQTAVFEAPSSSTIPDGR